MGYPTKVELQDDLRDLRERYDDLQRQSDSNAKALAAEQNVVRALKERLILAETKLIALKIVHGDCAPELYESRRRIAEQGVNQIITAVKVAPLSA